jgi:AcrR family transcriptional regulator
MQEPKQDRRVNRTRRLLRESLMKLVVEKGYDSVTIEDITEKAELGRTTFYLHYRDKEELLLESIDAIAEELTAHIYQQIQAGNPSGRFLSGENQFRPIQFVFEHASNNRMLYQIILRGEGSTIAASRIRQIIFDAAQMFFLLYLGQEKVDSIGKANMDIIAAYFSSSLLGFLTWWLESESKIPPAEIGEIIQNLIFRGIGQYF